MENPLLDTASDQSNPVILGVKVTPLTVAMLHEEIEQRIGNHDKSLVLNVNVHALNLAQEEPWLRDLFNSSSIVFCDGAGVILGARLLGYHIEERITYADWLWQLADFCADKGFSLYLLGGRPGIAEAAADKLRMHSPQLTIAGVHHGFFDQQKDSAENAAVIAQVNAVRPDILLVCFGMPRQEAWLRDNWEKIDAVIALTGGAALDYVSGNLRRGPKWMTDNGLEWLARMIVEPRRLWRRYIVGNPLFLRRVVEQRMRNNG